MRNSSLSKVVVRCKTSYTGLFSFLAIPLLMGDIMIEFMNMIDINGWLFVAKKYTYYPSLSEHYDHNGGDNNGNNSSTEQQQ